MQQVFIRGFKFKKGRGFKIERVPFQFNNFRLNHPEHVLQISKFQAQLHFVRKIKITIVVPDGSYSTTFSVFFKQKLEYGPQSSTANIARRELVVLRHNVICRDLYADNRCFVHNMAQEFVQKHAEEIFGTGPDFPSSGDICLFRVKL
jgi:hypothetical protein